MILFFGTCAPGDSREGREGMWTVEWKVGGELQKATMGVCARVCTCVCANVCAYMCTCMCKCVCACVCMRVCTCVCVYAHMHYSRASNGENDKVFKFYPERVGNAAASMFCIRFQL